MISFTIFHDSPSFAALDIRSRFCCRVSLLIWFRTLFRSCLYFALSFGLSSVFALEKEILVESLSLMSFLALLVRPGLNESLGLKLLKGAHSSRALTTLFVKLLVLVSMSFVEDISDQSWFRKASIHLVFVKSLKLLFIVAGLFSLAGLVVSLVVIDTIIGR